MAEQLVNIKFDAAQTYRSLNSLQKDQFPFAYAKALTLTAKRGQLAGRARTREAFKLHGEFIPNNIRMKPASKKDFQMFHHTEAVVFTSDLIKDFTTFHEEGGTKKARGKSLSIPGQDILSYQYKTKSGRLKKTYRPGEMLSKGSPSQTPKKRKRLSRKAFIIPQKGTQPSMVVRRVARGKSGLETMFIFKPTAKIQPTWGLTPAVERMAALVYRDIFNVELNKAIQNAR